MTGSGRTRRSIVPISPSAHTAAVEAPAPQRASHPRALAPVPARVTSFVGRADERRAIEALLAATGPSARRLITIVGPGGAGKTRLAIEVAATAGRPVAFVDLSALDDPRAVVPTVARALGLGEASAAALVGALASVPLLLVLDNLEQVVATGPALAALLRACPALAILATSREALRVPEEQIVPLAPLPVPPADAPRKRTAPFQQPGSAAVPLDLDVMLGYEAVRLFVDRAGDADPRFALTHANAGAVADLCRRLDGLALAIELAAARVSQLPPAVLLARLEAHLPVPTAGPRDVPERQRTVEATIAWSYELLSPDERRLFRRLAVFVDGAPVDAVVAVGGPEDRAAAVALLDALASKSLIELRPVDGDLRAHMLETIREFAARRLAASPECADVRSRHAAHYADLAIAAAPHLGGPEQAAWFGRLDREQANLDAALAALPDSGRALRMAAALTRFWDVRGHAPSTPAVLQALLQRSDPAVPIAARADGLRTLAVLVADGGDHARAHRLLEESLTIWRALGDEARVAQVLSNLGHALLRAGRPDEAVGPLEEALAIRRRGGPSVALAGTLTNLALAAHRLGDDASAGRHLEEGLRVARAAGDRWAIANVTYNGANMAVERERSEGVAPRLRESLEIWQALGYDVGVALVLEAYGALALIEGDPGRATRLIAASAALRARIGRPAPAADNERRARRLGRARGRLGEEAMASARAEGAAMSRDAAIAYALETPRDR